MKPRNDKNNTPKLGTTIPDKIFETKQKSSRIIQEKKKLLSTFLCF